MDPDPDLDPPQNVMDPQHCKIHQTLVLLNLLSFRTKDLAAPTIDIQSAANHNTLLRHFDTSVPTVPAVTAIHCKPDWIYIIPN